MPHFLRRRMLTASHHTGEIATTMDKLTKRALQAQVEAAVRPVLIRTTLGETLTNQPTERRSREQQ